MKTADSKQRMWTLVKDLDKGVIGFWRYDIPYFVISLPEWSYMIANPTIIIGKPDVDESTTPEDDATDYLHGLA